MAQQEDSQFRDLVYATVAKIPAGHVVSYGQVAALSGNPRASRIVGQIARFGPSELPWQRVVYKDGRLAGAFPGGRVQQAAMLKEEGITVRDYMVDIQKYAWWPND